MLCVYTYMHVNMCMCVYVCAIHAGCTSYIIYWCVCVYTRSVVAVNCDDAHVSVCVNVTVLACMD